MMWSPAKRACQKITLDERPELEDNLENDSQAGSEEDDNEDQAEDDLVCDMELGGSRVKDHVVNLREENNRDLEVGGRGDNTKSVLGEGEMGAIEEAMPNLFEAGERGAIREKVEGREQGEAPQAKSEAKREAHIEVAEKERAASQGSMTPRDMSSSGVAYRG